MATALPPPSIFPPPRIVYTPNKYKLEELVGSGTFAEVFRIRHNETSEAVALKHFYHSSNPLVNFKVSSREIAFMKIMVHPNIVSIKLYDINKSFIFIGMEYMGCGNLRLYLREKKPIAENIIRFVMRQLIAALDYMHAFGIFHGDVKPDNILCEKITQNGPMIKLCDFGLSDIKLIGDDNMVFKSGSYLFMAPEVHLRYPADCTIDLWSAGVVMYVMMFGRTIFRLSERDRTKHISYLKRREPICWIGSEIYSSECNALVRHLLCYDKHHRLSGKFLRCIPFLRLTDPVVPGAEVFARSAHENINAAVNSANLKHYGAALVLATEAIFKLKIQYNLIPHPDIRNLLKIKWQRYEGFVENMELSLNQGGNLGLNCPKSCDDMQFRTYLTSSPRLLDGFDMGCNGEMYYREGKIERALPLLQRALEILVPLIGCEPMSNRKQILGKRIEKWLSFVEVLTGNRPAPSQPQAQSAESATNATSTSTATTSEPKQ